MHTQKKALIFGITGQDGSYLTELLLSKGYRVFGVKRRSSGFNTSRIDHLLTNPDSSSNLKLFFGDLCDQISIIKAIEQSEPDEIYNLAAQSHVQVSFSMPDYTNDINATGTLRILEALRMLNTGSSTRFYQASSSELYGDVLEIPQNELTPFNPQSPYAISKLYSYWITKNYRQSYGMFASNGILFNHESPRRGETFVTRKITRGISRIACGLEQKLILGNLDSKRDWGHARDYVLAQWLILQHHCPDDFVISTGIQSSVREFVKWACRRIGIEVQFEGRAIDEKGIVTKVNNKDVKLREGSVIIEVSEKYFRPSEVNSLCGDPQKAKKDLNWSPTLTAEQLCWEMIDSDMIIAKSECNHKHQI